MNKNNFFCKTGRFKEKIIAARMLTLTRPVQELFTKKPLSPTIIKFPWEFNPTKEELKLAIELFNAPSGAKSIKMLNTAKIKKNFNKKNKIFLSKLKPLACDFLFNFDSLLTFGLLFARVVLVFDFLLIFLLILAPRFLGDLPVFFDFVFCESFKKSPRNFL